LVFEGQTEDSEDSELIELISLTSEGGSKAVKNENLFEDEDDQTISTNKFDQYKEYWLYLPEEINMVKSNKSTSTSFSMNQRNQYESDDEEDRERKSSVKVIIPSDKKG
jgi:hypothetical protein